MIRYMLEAGDDGMILRADETAGAGRRSRTKRERSSLRFAVISGDPSALIAWWTAESARALDATWTDAMDVLFHACRAGFHVHEGTVRAQEMAPLGCEPIHVEGRDVQGTIAWTHVEITDCETLSLVALPPQSRPLECARRLYRWAQELGREAIEAMSFDGFVRAAESALNETGRAPKGATKYRRDLRLDVRETVAAQALADAFVPF